MVTTATPHPTPAVTIAPIAKKARTSIYVFASLLPLPSPCTFFPTAGPGTRGDLLPHPSIHASLPAPFPPRVGKARTVGMFKMIKRARALRGLG
eukprot:2945874-Pyramimonas_sp.AAC.2